MSIKQIRLSNQAKEQFILLKTRTGIARWNSPPAAPGNRLPGTTNMIKAVSDLVGLVT
jgi:hypothetical protein